MHFYARLLWLMLCLAQMLEPPHHLSAIILHHFKTLPFGSRTSAIYLDRVMGVFSKGFQLYNLCFHDVFIYLGLDCSFSFDSRWWRRWRQQSIQRLIVGMWWEMVAFWMSSGFQMVLKRKINEVPMSTGYWGTQYLEIMRIQVIWSNGRYNTITSQ